VNFANAMTKKIGKKMGYFKNLNSSFFGEKFALISKPQNCPEKRKKKKKKKRKEKKESNDLRIQ